MTVVRNSVTVSMDSCFLNIQMVLGVVLVNQFKTTQTRTLTLSCCIHTGRREKRRNTTESAAEGIEREGRTTRMSRYGKSFFQMVLLLPWRQEGRLVPRSSADGFFSENNTHTLSKRPTPIGLM